MNTERIDFPPAHSIARHGASKLVIGISLLLVLLSLYFSFRVVSGLFGIEPDASHSLMLWQGVREHGFSWMKEWLFTQDNWLLSLVPIHFIAFSVVGAEAWVVLVFGWLIFVLSAFVAAAVVWKAGAGKVAFFVFLALLNLGLYAHQHGFVSYATSHNITNLFGLLSILVLLAWSEKPANGLLALMLFLLLAGAVSDPWMLASYNLPVFLVGAFFLARPSGVVNRWQGVKLLGIGGISILAVKTRLFGLLDFLPIMHFQVGDWPTINHNAIYLVKDLGGLLNIVPFSSGGNNFLPGMLSIVVLGGLLLVCAAALVKSGRRPDNVVRAFYPVAVLSIGGIVTAFVVSSVEAWDHSARFLINAAYLTVILLGVLAGLGWRYLAEAGRQALVVVFCLFLTASLFSNADLVARQGFGFRDTGVQNTISFLKSHALTYGYGPYWGANANAVTAASNAEVRIRPVVFDKKNGKMIYGSRPETSARWYKPEDVPEGTANFFVMVKQDGEECPLPDLCLSGLVAQFGEPERRLAHGGATILVWNEPLLGRPRPVLDINLNEVYQFNQSGRHVNGAGWSQPEAGGTWTDGDVADLRLSLRGYEGGDLMLRIDANAFLFNGHDTLTVRVVANGQPVGELMYRLADSAGTRIIKIPASAMEGESDQLQLRFNIDSPRSPLELGASGDPRKLGINLAALSFQPLGAEGR